MPRKKASEVSTGRPISEGPAMRVKCPACQSEISSDGGTLHKKSGYLDDLLETGSSIEEIEKAMQSLETRYTQSKEKIAELESQLKQKTEKEKPQDAQPVQKVAGGKQRDSWW